jgi:hypothetical protein
MAVSVTPIRAGILTDYLLGGALTLKNGRIDKCYFEGGFARAFETSATTDRFVFYYYNKDHLGNNREVVDIKGRIHQVTNITKATKDYVVGKAVGLLNRKTVNPTSNNKAAHQLQSLIACQESVK